MTPGRVSILEKKKQDHLTLELRMICSYPTAVSSSKEELFALKGGMSRQNSSNFVGARKCSNSTPCKFIFCALVDNKIKNSVI